MGPKGPGPEGAHANDFLVRGLSLFLATDYAGIYRSNDSGRTWMPMNIGLGNRDVTGLANHGTDIFAATLMSIYRSTDGGSTWGYSAVPSLNRAIYDMASAGGNVFAATDVGVFRSTDSGVSWDSANAGLPSRDINVFLKHGDTLFAGTSSGVCHTTNGGTNWVTDTVGLTNEICQVPSCCRHDSLCGDEQRVVPIDGRRSGMDRRQYRYDLSHN